MRKRRELPRSWPEELIEVSPRLLTLLIYETGDRAVEADQLSIVPNPDNENDDKTGELNQSVDDDDPREVLKCHGLSLRVSTTLRRRKTYRQRDAVHVSLSSPLTLFAEHVVPAFRA